MLRAIGGTAMTTGVSGCFGLVGEDERDVSLDRSNWVTPNERDIAVASGYYDLSGIHSEIQGMSGVTWKAFLEWLTTAAPQAEEKRRRPVVPHDVLGGGGPFVVGYEDGTWFHSRNVPAVGALTIGSTGDLSEHRHLTAYQLPDDRSKSELKEKMSNLGSQFRQVNGVSVTKPKPTTDDTGESVYHAFALEDDLLLNEVGLGQITADESDYHLRETLEDAGHSRDLGSHPVTDVLGMDMISTYGMPLIENDSITPVSRSVGIDLSNQVKQVSLAFANAGAAKRSREWFEIDSEGDLVVQRDGTRTTFSLELVNVRDIRQQGRGLHFEANILDLAKTISDGPPIWSYGVLDF
jgi:hypothetical protein